MLGTSTFSFSHNVFKKVLSEGRTSVDHVVRTKTSPWPQSGSHEYQYPVRKLTFVVTCFSGLIRCCNILKHGSVTLSIIAGCFICIPIKNSRITKNIQKKARDSIFVGFLKSSAIYIQPLFRHLSRKRVFENNVEKGNNTD